MATEPRTHVARGGLPAWLPWAIAFLAVAITAAALLSLTLRGGDTPTIDVPSLGGPSIQQQTTTLEKPELQQAITLDRPEIPEPPKLDLGFQGRTTPSDFFPLSDEEYIIAGKIALEEPRVRTDLFKLLGDPSTIDLIPIRVQESLGRLYVYFAVNSGTPEYPFVYVETRGNDRWSVFPAKEISIP